MNLQLVIDLETLDTKVTAAVLEIGATVVDFDNPEEPVKGNVSFIVDIESAMRWGTVGAKTLRWWMYEAGEQARDRLFNTSNGMDMQEAIEGLTSFIVMMEKVNEAPILGIWGNGSIFDIGILQRLYDEMAKIVPWHFRDIKDMRTIVDTMKVLNVDVPWRTIPNAIRHSGKDDSLSEAFWLTDAHFMLKRLAVANREPPRADPRPADDAAFAAVGQAIAEMIGDEPMSEEKKESYLRSFDGTSGV